ncbi:glycosyltransferase [Candidatus Parcubacteria bacterium]|nr:glycosyltransferase [Candidatus Parcubacteria bacterium]
MKILMLAPLERAVNEKQTAARPRLVFDLASQFIKKGHSVSLIGTADSSIRGAKIIPVIEKGFYELQNMQASPTTIATNWLSYLTKQAKIAEQLSSKFDVVHSHTKPELLPLMANLECPLVTTLHLMPDTLLDETLSLFKANFVVPSKAVQQKMKTRSLIIYHGIDTNLYSFKREKSDYLFWLGRVSMAKNKQGKFADEKGASWAIRLALATDSKLIMSGNVENKTAFEKIVKPHLTSKIKWVGGISFEQPLTKQQVIKLYQKAKAVLITSQLEETFCLVAAEAQSCGTPVIAFDRGALKEVVKNGKTGFIVKPNSLPEMKKALKKMETIKPEDCRQWVEQNFSLNKMADNYLDLYKKLINKK